MRKYEAWMKRGARVTACGDAGTLTKIVGTTIRIGAKYVFNIRVRLDGEKISRVYHPGDVQELIEDEN